MAKRRPGAEDLTGVTLNLYRNDVLRIKALAAKAGTSYQVWIRERVREAVSESRGVTRGTARVVR